MLVGVLGGGQLGQMLALAGLPLGLRFRFLDPSPDACAIAVGELQVGSYDDDAALARFAAGLDVVTYEFENVPVAAAAWLARRVPVFPPPAALEASQDRLTEKSLFRSLGVPTVPFEPVDKRADLTAALGRLGLPAVLKTRRFGYDGKGQAIIREGDDIAKVWTSLATKSAILEAFVPFEREISVIAARSAAGQVECFDVTENEHRDHILKISRAPAPIPDALAEEARSIAGKIASALDYVGVLAVEMFVLANGTGPKVLVNEIAPRVHNSGHWTLDGASVSQFEQHIRAIAGWPLGKPVRHGEVVTMTNLIGDEINDYEKWLSVPGATVHIYGKGAPRPGRKMGHVTEVRPSQGK